MLYIKNAIQQIKKKHLTITSMSAVRVVNDHIFIVDERSH